MSGVGGGELGGPFGDLVVGEGAGLGRFVEEVVDDDHRPYLGMGFEVLVVAELGILVLFGAGIEGDLTECGGGGLPDFLELRVEGFGKAGLGSDGALGG